MENPKSIDVSLWSRQGPWVPSCRWMAYPNNPEQIACFSAAQLLTFFWGKKPTDRHEGMDNRKKHVCTVGLCAQSECMCVHCVLVDCGKGRWKKRTESSETYAVGSDRRPVTKKEMSTPITVIDSSTSISEFSKVNYNMENGQMEMITAHNATYKVIDLLYGLH